MNNNIIEAQILEIFEKKNVRDIEFTLTVFFNNEKRLIGSSTIVKCQDPINNKKCYGISYHNTYKNDILYYFAGEFYTHQAARDFGLISGLTQEEREEKERFDWIKANLSFFCFNVYNEYVKAKEKWKKEKENLEQQIAVLEDQINSKLKELPVIAISEMGDTVYYEYKNKYKYIKERIEVREPNYGSFGNSILSADEQRLIGPGFEDVYYKTVLVPEGHDVAVEAIYRQQEEDRKILVGDLESQKIKLETAVKNGGPSCNAFIEAALQRLGWYETDLGKTYQGQAYILAEVYKVLSDHGYKLI
jgi:hypothetical protein